MDISQFEHLKVTTLDEGRIVVCQFDHGKANEMGYDQVKEVERLAELIESSPEVGALISFSSRTSSKGTPIFIAGANVKERLSWGDDKVRQHVRWQRRVLVRVRRLPVFHACVVNGVALGWGTEYLLASDYRIATPEARFGLPETSLGILPGAGGTAELWSQIGVAQTMRLGMTGERIDADEARRIGLIQEQEDNLDVALDRARKLARKAVQCSPTANANFKRAVLQNSGQAQAEREETEARAYERCLDSGDAAQGRQNFSAILAGERPPWNARTN